MDKAHLWGSLSAHERHEHHAQQDPKADDDEGDVDHHIGLRHHAQKLLSRDVVDDYTLLRAKRTGHRDERSFRLTYSTRHATGS